MRRPILLRGYHGYRIGGWIPTVAVRRRHGLGVGSNSDGQLGDGTSLQQLTPVQVTGLTGLVADRGDRTVAVKADGTVWAWGYNGFARLGTGRTNRSIPVQVPGVTGIVAISAGVAHTVASRATARFGRGDASANWGRDIAATSDPVQAGLTGVVAVSAGNIYAVAVRRQTVWAWGRNWSTWRRYVY
jgi:hypothetical protein